MSADTKQDFGAPSSLEWEVVHPQGVALRTHPDYNARVTSVAGPAASSKIVAAGPPITALGSNIQMIQITHINGQMYPPTANGPRYWVPLRTSEGQEVLRPTQGMAPPALPKYEATPSAVWVQASAPDGRPYWYKEGTQETTWDNPYANQTILASPATSGAVPAIWTQLRTADGQTYYHNPQTNETAWSLPPGATVGAQPQQWQPPAQNAAMYAQPTQVYVAQPVNQGPVAPSRELREARLQHARRHGGGMTFF